MAPSSDRQLITDRQLRSWLRCRRKAWLDRHGNPSEKRWNPHRALQLADRESRLQRLMGPGAAAAPSLDQLNQGQKVVRQLLLQHQELRGRPTLLLRQGGQSRLGAFSYQPALLQPGRHGTREHRLTLGFWGLLLEPLLGVPVTQGLLLDPQGGKERVQLQGSQPRQLSQALERLQQDLENRQAPPLTNDRKKCSLCSWKRSCDEVAEAEGHLSQVSGIGGKRRDLLQQLGVADRAALAGTKPEWLMAQLEKRGEQRPELALELIAQAQVQETGLPQALGPGASQPLPELAQAPGVLIYDIESDPDARDDFLHGFLILRRGADGQWPAAATAPYHPLLALQEHGEARCWQRLQRLLRHHQGWPVLHYGETEAIALRRMAERQGGKTPPGLLDLHKRVRQHWRLPVDSYGLKAVAQWQGFRWSQSSAEGARCVLWWRQWRARGDRHNLERIFRYNHDDCLATWAVAQWLVAAGSDS
jgi:uncharacterized protein